MSEEDFECSEKDYWKNEDRSGYVWCLHCGLAYEKSAFINNAIKIDWQGCLTVGCGGAGWETDIFSWSINEWPRKAHPEYPDIPVEGKYYPEY